MIPASLVLMATGSGCKRGRGSGRSRRGRGGNSSGMTESEAFPAEGWTCEMPSSADVAFERRTGPSEDFRHDESALGYLMTFLGLHFFIDLFSSPMAYQINILIPI